MFKFKPLLFLVFLVCTYVLNAQQTVSINPLLVHSNAPIPFNKINAAVIKSAASELIKRSDAAVKKITAVPTNGHNVNNTLLAMDQLVYNIIDLNYKLYVISSTYMDDSTRNAANDEVGRLGVYSGNLFLNNSLYQAIKKYATTEEAKKLPANRKKFLKGMIVSFEKRGMKLNATERKKLEAFNEKMVEYSLLFDKNIAESKDSVAFTEVALQGVPTAISAEWKRDNGEYVVYVNGPNYSNILKYAEPDNTRKTFYTHYNNRAYPQNITALDSLLYYRNLYAKTLGFRSYANFALVDKMAASAENVWNFENDLVAKLKTNTTKELDELGALKKQLHPEGTDTIYAWDLSLYRKKLLDRKYQLNTDEVKEYFEMNNTLNGMFTVYEKLFNIKIKSIDNVPVWHEKVKSFEMFKEGKKVGSFYLDLFPRENKFTHFACFGINQYSSFNGKEILPVSTLICNFPEGNASQPSLLNHSDVVTLFHEFGHLVHSLLARSNLSSQGPFNVKEDFVEAPSQFLENWCWQYESLSMFAKNYKTNQPLPRSLFDKMKKARHVGVALDYTRQLYLGMVDFTYEDKYDSIKNIPLSEVSKDLFSMCQIPYPEGSNFICSFGHLNDYAANYYGYLWSKVFAEDMFSVFKKKGVMDPATGVSYRKKILEQGSTMEEMDMLRNFLGREPNNAAFLESLGIEITK